MLMSVLPMAIDEEDDWGDGDFEDEDWEEETT